MADTLQVEMVSADREVWSGEAQLVITRTTEGEIGIMAHHEPTLAVLAPGTVQIKAEGAPAIVAAVDGGFLSVANNRVSVLSEHVDLADEIDAAAARSALERAEAADDGSEEAAFLVAAARAKVAAVDMD